VSQNKNIKTQETPKVIKVKVIVKPYYTGDKSLIDAFTKVIIRVIEKRTGTR